MFPTVVMVQSQIDLHKRTPFGSLGFANKVHPSFLRSMVGLACITRNPETDYFSPGGGPAPVTRNHMVEIKVLAIKYLPKNLTCIVFSLKKDRKIPRLTSSPPS